MAGGLKVDEVVLGGVERRVPVAVVSVVVPHSELGGLGQAVRGQFGRVVVGHALGLGLAVGQGHREAVLRA